MELYNIMENTAGGERQKLANGRVAKCDQLVMTEVSPQFLFEKQMGVACTPGNQLSDDLMYIAKYEVAFAYVERMQDIKFQAVFVDHLQDEQDCISAGRGWILRNQYRVVFLFGHPRTFCFYSRASGRRVSSLTITSGSAIILTSDFILKNLYEVVREKERCGPSIIATCY